MSDKSTGIAFRTVQEAMPEYHISDDLVLGVLSAMQPPATNASDTWCREWLARVIDEVAARASVQA
jgi:hypothetical protein